MPDLGQGSLGPGLAAIARLDGGDQGLHYVLMHGRRSIGGQGEIESELTIEGQ